MTGRQPSQEKSVQDLQVSSIEQETARGPASMRTFASQDLFAGSSEIGIEHSGTFYRLKITRQGKLILNK